MYCCSVCVCVCGSTVDIFSFRQFLLDEYIHKNISFYEQNMIIVNDKSVDYK